MSDIERALLELRVAAQTDTFGQFEPRTLCWLALLPEWTDTLAITLGLADSTTLPGIIERLDQVGLIERRRLLGEDEVQHEAFWIRSRKRAGVGDYLRTHHRDRLQADADELFDAVSALKLGASPLVIWRVVGGFRRDPTGLGLLSYVDNLVADGDLAAAASAVAAARAAGDLLGDPLEDAARRAEWLLDRARRTADDEVQLRDYRRREHAEQALGDLLLGSGEQWAVHLLGAAGVGKTMIVRYLTCGRFAADRGLSRFAVARVDFDHLDPRYPEQRPAELLQALADELVGFTSTRGGHHQYRRFLDSADELHEVMSSADPDLGHAEELLRAAVKRFARLTNELPKPVVLVLDTCEELAKLYAPGTSAPAVDRTFELLELVHQQVPRLRVVMAGRRWLVPSADTLERAGGPLLRPRPYMRVLAVGGFSEPEAADYLDERGIAPALRSALLDRAVVAGENPRRYNPFELAGYCEWALSDPALDADQLRDAPGDPYVERRVIGRIVDRQVHAALGIAAELGRFDHNLIAPALRRASVDSVAAFDGLAAQEWVNVRSLGADGRPRVIEVDEHLRDRLRRVTARDPALYPVDRAQLGRDAADVIDRTPVGDLPAETVEAAVRLLPVAAAAELWARIDQRVLDGGHWAWAGQITPRVGAVELERAGASILASILAAQAASRIHAEQRRGLVSLWEQVESLAHRHPDPGTRERLSLRARLGRIAAGDFSDLDVLAELVDISSEVFDAVAGSVLAALEDDYDWLLRMPLLQRLSTHQDRAVAASALVLIASRGPTSSDYAKRAVEAARSAPAARWADWIPPRRLLDRCRLMRMIVALRGGDAISERELSGWRADAVLHLDDVDAERLAAATYRYELSLRPVPEERLIAVPLTEPRQRPLPWPHGRIPPLVVEIADAWSVLGKPDVAHELLRAARKAAVDSGTDPDMVEACDLALVRLCRRYRTTRYAPVQTLSREATPLIRAEAWLVRTLVDGERPPTVEEPSRWIRWDSADVWAIDRLTPAGVGAFRKEVESTARSDAVPSLATARSALATAEVIALDSPQEATSALRAVAQLLRQSGGLVEAAQAKVLAVLAAQRAGHTMAVPFETGEADLITQLEGTGWPERFVIAWSYLQGRPSSDVRSGSPELPSAPVEPAAGSDPVSLGAMLGRAAVQLLRRQPREYDFPEARAITIATSANGDVLLDVWSHKGVSELDGVPTLGQLKRGLLKQTEPLRRWQGDLQASLERAKWPDQLPLDSLVLVQLEIGVDNQIPAWEQLLARSLPGGLTDAVAWFRLEPGARRQLTRKDWANSSLMYRGPNISRDKWFGEDSALRRMLYLVGTPVSTSAGWCLRVKDAVTQSSQSSSRGTIGREEILDLDELTAEPTVTVVLQADAVDRRPQPLGDQREGFLALARIALDNGADSVVIIPPLPDGLAAAVAEEVDRRVGDTATPPSCRTMLELAVRLRRSVVREQDSVDRPDLDLLLFLRTAM